MKLYTIFAILFLLGCSAEVSYERAATAPLEVASTLLCVDKPAANKEGYCSRPVAGKHVPGNFFAAAVVQNANCVDKMLVGRCSVNLKDASGEILFETEVPLQSEVESCLVPPKERKFLCHLNLDPAQLDPGNYVVDFLFEDSAGSRVNAPVDFVVS